MAKRGRRPFRVETCCWGGWKSIYLSLLRKILLREQNPAMETPAAAQPSSRRSEALKQDPDQANTAGYADEALSKEIHIQAIEL